MSFLAGLLLGIFGPLVVAALVMRLRKKKAQSAPPASAPASPKPDTPQTPMTKLMALTGALDAAGEASAHPRDLVEHDAFKKAVDLMKSSDFPASALVDYAIGANWMLSSAALDALRHRTDRDSPA